MAFYFTDTYPTTLVTLNSHTLYDGAKQVTEMNQDRSLPAASPVEWDITDIDGESARFWCLNNDFIAVLLKGKASMTLFKSNFIGNEDTFLKPPNRLKGDPIILKPEDVCLVMHQLPGDNQLEWKLIENLRRV